MSLLSELHIAVRQRNISKVSELLKQRVNVNSKSQKNHHSPLITAIQTGSIPMIELLLDYGAEIDNSKEMTDCNSPLFHAISYYPRLDLVELLLERGANLNFIDRGQKPTFEDYLLHHIIYRKYESLVPIFLKYGADIHCRDECGDTPLMIALLTGCESIALQLIEAGADINVSNPLGLTPFHGAFNYQMTRVIKILADQNVDLDPKTLRLNWTAESEEHLEARDRLVAKNTRITNSKDYNLRFDRQSLYEKETLILFFGLDAQSQIDILPDLDKKVMFDCRMGEVFTDQSLCGLTSLYEANLNSGLNSLISMENEYLYSQLEYVRSLICSWIQFTESKSDSFWEPESLLTPQWTLIRLSSQFIKQYLAINRGITKDDLDKCYIPMNAD